MASHSSKNSGSSPSDIAEWAEKGRMDTKGLSKALPDVAAQLRKGDLRPDDVPEIVRQATEDHVGDELRKALAPLLTKAAESQGGEPMCVKRLGALEIMTQAEHLLCDLIRVPVGADEDLSFRFAFHFFGNKRECPAKWKGVREKVLAWVKMEDEMHKNINEGNSSAVVQLALEMQEPWTIIQEIHQAYITTCRLLRVHIEKLARKPMEAHCWAYTESVVDFTFILQQLIHRSDNFGLDQLVKDLAHTSSLKVGPEIKAAAQGIQDGQDKIRKACWECGKDTGSVYKCAACSAARYCSRECQRKSWKSGHKGACSHLGTMYPRFLENHRRVDQAMREVDPKTFFGKDGRSMPPAGTKDYQLLPMFLSHLTFPVTLSIDIVTLGATSIDNMYKNIDDIVKGRSHWMFNDSFQGNWKEYIDFHVLQRADAFEVDYVLQGLLFLTVEVCKLGPVAPVAVELFRRQLHKTSAEGELMSATRFLEIYYRFGLAEREGYEKPGARLESYTKCMRLMMDFFHKNNGPLDVRALREEAVESFAGFHWTSMVEFYNSSANRLCCMGICFTVVRD